jgi:hypothetical protein
MLSPAKTKRPQRQQIAQTASYPAPIGGWNARDSWASMKPSDAVKLTNLFPGTSEVLIRKGYSQYSTGLPAQVETLMAYNAPASSSQLWAISNGAIYNCTAGGAVGAAATSGLTNSRWQYINVTTAGGSFLYLVNGVDKPRLYDGATWTAIDAVSVPAVTGVTTTNLSNIALFKNRVWFVEKNSLKAWYLPTGAVGGAANVLDLSSVAMNGGHLVAIGTWTLDAGYGMDDYIVFVTSEGDVIVYRGTDPSSSTTWFLAGVWAISSPLGSRCFLKYAGDLLLICQDGIIPMAGGLQSSRVDPRLSLTDKIQWAISQASTVYGSNFGWQMINFPKANMLLLNVPVSEGSGQVQFAMNTITRSWCDFSGWQANCFELFNDDMYFGGSTVVCKAWDTLADNGANIETDAITAFSYMKTPASIKQWRMVRTIIRSNGNPSVRIGINTDYQVIDNTGPVSYTPGSVALWDIGKWDVARWGGDLDIIPSWKSISAKPGYSAAIRFKSSSNGIDVRWVACDLAYEPGGVVG